MFLLFIALKRQKCFFYLLLTVSLASVQTKMLLIKILSNFSQIFYEMGMNNHVIAFTYVRNEVNA